MIKWIKRYKCKRKGHRFITYAVPTSSNPIHWHDIEQAGYCERCGYDTHGEYDEGRR